MGVRIRDGIRDGVSNKRPKKKFFFLMREICFNHRTTLQR